MKIFPSESEFLCYSGKLGDMEALDDIARSDASYRPPTCRMSAGKSYHPKHDSCPFNDSTDYVSKRSNSYGWQHVEFRPFSIETVVHRHVGSAYNATGSGDQNDGGNVTILGIRVGIEDINATD